MTYFYHQQRLDWPDLRADLKVVIKAIFEQMKHCHGYRRVHSELHKRGWEVNHKPVYKLMD